jgi:hypothetical protein
VTDRLRYFFTTRVSDRPANNGVMLLPFAGQLLHNVSRAKADNLDFCTCATMSYDETLGTHHPFIIRVAAKAGMKFCPTMDSFEGVRCASCLPCLSPLPWLYFITRIPAHFFGVLRLCGSRPLDCCTSIKRDRRICPFYLCLEALQRNYAAVLGFFQSARPGKFALNSGA